MKKILVALCASVMLLASSPSAKAEVAPLMPYHWDACVPVLWSYDGSALPKHNHTRVLKSIRTAARMAQSMSGVVIREAGEGETPSLSIVIRPTIIPGVFADTIPYIDVETGLTVVKADLELAPALIPKYRHDQKLLFLHEMGHVLGLGHSADVRDLMVGRPMGSRNRAGKRPPSPLPDPTTDDYTAFASVPDCMR